MSQRTITDSDLIDGMSVWFLKFFGIWGVMNHYRNKGERNGWLKFLVLGTVCSAIPYAFFQFLCFFTIKVDLQKASIISVNAMHALQMCCKILVLWFNFDSHCRLYDIVRKDFLRVIPESERKRSKEIYERVSKMTNLSCSIIIIIPTSCITVSLIVPDIPVDYIHHGYGDVGKYSGGRKKILAGWYPVPMAESPYYEIIYVYETYDLLWAGLFMGVYASMYFQVLMCLYAQFSAFAKFVSSTKFETGNKNAHYDNEMMYERLRGIVQEHQKLISYTNELKRVYNPLVTITLGMGIIVLIMTVFQFLFVGMGSPLLLFKTMQYLAFQVCEVATFCFGSSYIEAASSNLDFAIYSSDWYRADKKFRNMAQMVMLRSKKRMTLTAIRMYPVNMETMMSIFQFTYSSSTLLSRMTD